MNYILSKKILIAEDNQTVGETFTQILQTRGYEVIWAKDGKETLDVYAKKNQIAKSKGEKPFDTVLMDVAMPKMNGIDVVKGILMMCTTQRIVFCTAFGKDLVREIPDYEKGIEILEKPISLAQLLNVVEGNYAKTIREKEADTKLKEWDNISELETPNVGTPKNS